MTAEGWVLIIGAFFVGVVGCINAWGTHYGRKEARVVADRAAEERKIASGKLDVIHDLTNSSMTALKAELATALARIDKLEGLLNRAVRRGDTGS